jgi:hypothetical protein
MPAVTPVAVERERIESWKGIAAYFGKYERTVKRWELERGLPIHRLPGKRGGVFAYEDELSAWRNSGAAERSVEADAEESPEPEAALQAELVAKPVVEPEFVVARHSGRWGVARWATVGVGLCALLFAGTHTLARTSRPVSTAVSDADGRQAHELYLKGRYEWNRRTPESLSRALDDFTQAIVHNPQDARSYVGLADTYNLLQIYSTLPLTD